MDNTSEIKRDSVEPETVVKVTECDGNITSTENCSKTHSDDNFSSDETPELGEAETNVNETECDIETFSAKDDINSDNSSEVNMENVISVDITPEKDGGVLKKVLKEGEGEEYPGYGDRVSVHYTGWRLGKEPVEFDSSRKGERFEFSLGRGQVIKGWDLGISTMKKGEIAVFIVHPRYAYGDMGYPPAIPPFTPLVFEIELFDWKLDDLSPKKDDSILRKVLEKGEGTTFPNEGSQVRVLAKSYNTCRTPYMAPPRKKKCVRNIKKERRNRRANESQEQREARLAADAVRRASQSKEQREARLAADVVRRASQSEEQRKTRVAADTIRRSTARGRECEESRQRRILGDWVYKENSAFAYDETIHYNQDPLINIGRMTVACSFCQALKWKGETPGMCCSNGKVQLPLLIDSPQPLMSLLTADSTEATHFRSNIRKYNSCFQMTSFGSTKQIKERGFMPTFKVQGQVYHRIGSLQPLPDEEPKFLQIYFVANKEHQAEQRCRNVLSVYPQIVIELQEMLHKVNSYIQSFKCAMEKMTPEMKIVIHADKTPIGEHERRFNAPISSEVAVVLAGEQTGNRDISLEMRNNIVKKIADSHRSYDALQYPLIFWQGDDGYNFNMKQINPRTGLQTTKNISAMDFYSYRMMFRASNFNIILRFKELFQQFAVDMFAKIESERLRYIRFNQKRLRAEEYIHLKDAINNDANVSDLGQLIILPSSFTGGPRYMHERTQDAMTYVRNFGKPDLFITFTCNPKWEEINKELLQGQKSPDRHDIVARVFRQKMKMLINLIKKGRIFGTVGCYMYTVEWQKRGLPHAHILVWLKDKIHVDRVDHLISAEIPNAETDPVLHDIITKQMIHGPCGSINPLSSCMKDGKCTKKYPRQFLQETHTDTDGYPLYRRRSPDNGGCTTIIKVKGTNVQVDNRWVVPFCPLLSKAFNAHINLEFCSSVKSIKYICKYVNKGSDMAMFTLETDENERDEVQQYEIGRYISSNEAIWRIFSFPIHERHPTVLQLSVHLENGQRVYFTTENAAQRAIAPPNTSLTAFFDLCRTDEFARSLLYHQLPKFYTWDPSTKKWNRRSRGQIVPEFPGIRSTDALGRVYTVHPNNSECFHLRMLLHEVTGPTSFKALKTVDGTVAETFKQACQLRGLLEDDAQWHRTLEEAAATRSPGKLRCLFAVMLQTCAMSNPLELWLAFREYMAEDLLHRARVVSGNIDLGYDDDIFNTALVLIEDRVRVLGGSELKVFGLPQTRREDVFKNYDLMRETGYNVDELTSFIESNEPNLVADQQDAYRKITSCVFDGTGGIFFIDAPGGTGKTFLINLLLAKVRQRKLVALAVASSGIAATLLTGGRTAHSVFKLPLNLANVESPTCNISRNSVKAKVLQECKLIVWDECTMAHKAAFEALDVTMQDLRHNNRIMGGAVLVLSGDFRQTLPVIPRGTKADEIQACIQRSYLWRHIQRFQLTTNMRVHVYGDTAGQEFAELLLRIGNGEMHYDAIDGMISLGNVGTNVDTSQQLIDNVFPNITQHFQNPKWLCERAILAPRNDSVDATNKDLLAKLPGSLQLYRSVDVVIDVNDSVHYPPETLNKLEISGVPPHRLELKVGAPIMLLRNLDPPTLCNGTRLIVKKLFSNVIEATIMAGHAAGKDVFIPRIPIIPSDLPVQFKRVLFPVRLSFAMSINKAQGQSLKVVGLDLLSPCFSHGQLYVGCSRVGNSRNLFLLTHNGKTKNVVYQEVLRSMSAVKVTDVKRRKSIQQNVATIYQSVESMCIEENNEEMGNLREAPSEEYIVTNNAAICDGDIKQTDAYVSAGCILPLGVVLQNESTEIEIVCNSSLRRIDNVTGENNKKHFTTIRGFTNDRFECYANCLIQCLYHSEDIKSKFINYNVEIQNHVLAYENDKSVDTKLFRQLARQYYLDNVNPGEDVLFTDGSQEDVFEFLNYLAQALPFLLYEISFTRHTKLQCLNCFHEVALHDMDSVIRIHIPTGGNRFNFEDLVAESVSSVENIERGCDFCGLSKTRKEEKLISPPNYLIMQMMIFTTQGKITDYKLLGVQTARLSIHDGLYEVISGIFHYGDSTDRGHYSSYHRLEDGWCHANDEQVVKQDWPTYMKFIQYAGELALVETEKDFILGEGVLVDIPEGLELALFKFHLKEKSLIYLRKKYAEDVLGQPEMDPDSEIQVKFEVTLLKFEKAKDVWEMNSDEKFEKAKLSKEKGVEFFKLGHYKLALKQFKWIVTCLENEPGVSPETQEDRKSLLLSGYMNIALCHQKLENHLDVVKMCNKVLALDPNNEKALFRRGQAKVQINDCEEALQDFQSLCSIKPDNKAAQNYVVICQNKMKQQNMKDKSTYNKMFEIFVKQDEERMKNMKTETGVWEGDGNDESTDTRPEKTQNDGLNESNSALLNANVIEISNNANGNLSF